jgi:MOSC domain-containing protein YiiM
MSSGPAPGHGAVPSASVKSVNIGSLVPNSAKANMTGIGKRAVPGPVWVSAPGPTKGTSGLEGDSIGDTKHHGGNDQAVYAFAREDMDYWEGELDRSISDGWFGENLTTLGIDPNSALIGERWQVGDELVLQVTCPRLPCKTFAQLMAVQGWARRFTERGRPGAYLKVVHPGPVRAGDAITVVHRPSHGFDITTTMWALTIKPQLLRGLLAAGDDLSAEMKATIEESLGTA